MEKFKLTYMFVTQLMQPEKYITIMTHARQTRRELHPEITWKSEDSWSSMGCILS